MAGRGALRRSRLLLGVATAAVLVTTSACTSSEDSPEETGRLVSPPAVELAPDGVPEDVSIGVVVSLTSAPGEGAQWNEAAEGARVAAYRYGLGHGDVRWCRVTTRVRPRAPTRRSASSPRRASAES